MWNVLRCRKMMERAKQLRKIYSKSHEEKTRLMLEKNMAIREKQISELMRKRETLARINEFISKQGEYVDLRLRSNKKLLAQAIDHWNTSSQETTK